MKKQHPSAQYKTYPLTEHPIDKDARFVIKKLTKKGFQAYLVGGCVRDLLLGSQPKDFDIATNATPNDVKKIFRHTRIVGRRFRLAHILFGHYKYIEVATFRSEPGAAQGANGQIMHDNVYGSIEQDAVRRDLTINALYYDIINEQIIDFVGGLSDINNKKLKIIGDAEKRYREDPVRMLRMVRFGAKLSFAISAQQGEQLRRSSHLLSHIVPARLFDEVLKLFHNAQARTIFKLLMTYDLWHHLFRHTPANAFIEAVLANTETRVQADLPLAPAFIFAVFLWQPFTKACSDYAKQYKNEYYACKKAAKQVIDQQNQQVMIPKWIASQIREIWFMQRQLEKKPIRQSQHLLTRRRFRASYDFLLLRSQSINPELAGTAAFWTDKQSESNG